MTGRVIVVGSINIDLVVRGERLPAPGETVTGGTFQRFHGGKGGNQAVAAARLGADVVFVGAVGDDEFGAGAIDALRAANVDVSAIQRLPDAPTGVALILVDAHGENLISVASGANAALAAADVRTTLERIAIGSGDVLVAGHESPDAAMFAALAVGRAAGARTILNPAPAAGLELANFGDVAILTPNRGELAQLAGDDDPIRGALTLAHGGLAVLVSMGAEGALLVHDGRQELLPAPQVTAIDATGAGDTLNGALAAGLAAGLTLDAAARRAVVAASLSVTRAGAREGMPTTAELDAFGHRSEGGTD